MVSLETIIQQKQSGGILSNTDIQFIVESYTLGMISDDKMTTWLNAVFQNGMSHGETLNYTRAMVNSGVNLNFSHFFVFLTSSKYTILVGTSTGL